MMVSGLYLSAAIVGLASLPHCLTMCGAICERSAHHLCDNSRHNKNNRIIDIIYYMPILVGRLISYAVAGALLSLFTKEAFNFLSSVAWLKPLWILLQIGIVLSGFWMLTFGEFPLFFSRISLFVKNIFGGQGSARSNAPSNIYIASIYSMLTGSLWAFFPCGVLHSVLMMASLASSPVEGATVMLIFGLTSSMSLVVGGWGWSYLMKRKSASNSLEYKLTPDHAAVWLDGTLSYRIAGLAVVVAGAWSVYHMLIASSVGGVQCG